MDLKIPVFFLFIGIGLVILAILELKKGEEIIPLQYLLRGTTVFYDQLLFIIFVAIKLFIGILLIFSFFDFIFTSFFS